MREQETTDENTERDGRLIDVKDALSPPAMLTVLQGIGF